MVAYSFQKRFVPFVSAGLEPGPWCPGMKRHTLRQPRTGRSQHVRPEQPVHLYTAMRTKHCRMVGLATCRVQIPVRILADPRTGGFTLCRREGPAPRSRIAEAAPIVRAILERTTGLPLHPDEMDDFARTDGFSSTAEMRDFFDSPFGSCSDGFLWGLDMVLIGWAPVEETRDDEC